MNTKCFGLIKNTTCQYSYSSLTLILNSEICWYYVSSTGTVFRGGYFAFTPDYLNEFPIPSDHENQRILKTLGQYLQIVDGIMRSFFDSLSNAAIYELYFPNELQSANKQILPHLGDLKPITDEMSEEEKLAIIQSEFERLYDPNHPVRNNLETLDSVEEVRIIKEALK